MSSRSHSEYAAEIGEKDRRHLFHVSAHVGTFRHEGSLIMEGPNGDHLKDLDGDEYVGVGGLSCLDIGNGRAEVADPNEVFAAAAVIAKVKGLQAVGRARQTSKSSMMSEAWRSAVVRARLGRGRRHRRVLTPGAVAPNPMTRVLLGDMKDSAVMVDVALNQKSCFETTKATTSAVPTCSAEGIAHYCVANTPDRGARTLTCALSNVSFRHAIATPESV